MAVKFANNVSTTLTSAINATQTTISVADASGLPSLSSGDYIYLTIDTDTASPTLEVVKVTAISSNSLTVVRGQDGTTASSFSAGVKVELRVTAAALDDISSQAQTAADTESVSIDGDTMTGDLTMSGNDTEIRFTGGNNRILFSGYRALEGSTNGGILQVGEGYATVQSYGHLNLTSGHAYKVNGTTVIDSSLNLSNIANFTSSGKIKNGSYTRILTGASNSGQITFNANWDGSGYVPDYAGASYAGMAVIKMAGGGYGRMQVHTKNSGTTSTSQALSTFTKVAEFHDAGYFDASNGLRVGGLALADTSRNITAGTISSGAIFSSGNITSSGRGTFRSGAGGQGIHLNTSTSWTSGILYAPGLLWREADGTNIAGIRGFVNSNGVNNLALGTGWLDQEMIISPTGVSISGNLSSSAITATGTISLSAASGAELRVKDTTNNAEVVVLAQNTDGWIGTKSDHMLKLGTNYAGKIALSTTGDFYPLAHNSYSLGTTGKRWSHTYTDDLTVTNNVTSGPISASGVISGGYDVANFYSNTAQANLNIGRSGAQRINMYVTDGTGFLRYYQDETDGTDHSFHFQIQSSSTGTNKFYFNKSVDITGSLAATSYSGSLASAVTATTQAASDNSTKVATTAYVTTAVDNIVGAAPGSLDTLNELAAALGNDDEFSTTVTNSIATKLPLAGGTMTGNINMGANYVELGNIDLYASGDSNSLHIHAPTAVIPPSTTTSNNPHLGLTNYRWQSVNAGSANFSGLLLAENGIRVGTGDHVTDGRATISFGEGTTTGDSMYIEYDGENLSGANNAIIIGSTNGSVGDIFRVTYGGAVKIGSNDVFHDGYHPNADKWTTGRTHTVTLTGQVTGTASQTVDGTGNKTWSINTTVNNDALNDQYVQVLPRHNDDGDSLIVASKASITVWDVSGASDDPSGASDGLVLSAGWDSSSWGIQQYHDFHTNDLYLRSKQNGTMSSWDKVFHDTYHPNADKLTTPRSIAGSSFDGTADISINYNNLTNKPSIPSVGNGTMTITAGASLTGGGSFTANQSGNSSVTVSVATPADVGSNWRDVVAWSGSALVKDTAVEIHGSGYLRASYLNMTHGVSTRNSDTVFFSSGDDYIRKNNAAGMRSSLDIYTKGEVDNLIPTIPTSLPANGGNADTVDGLHAASFLRSDANDTHAHTLTFSKSGSGNFMVDPGGVKFASVGTGDLVLRSLDQLRFQSGNDWDWNKWAGIKYDSVNNNLHIGGPASSAFASNASPPNISVQFSGTNSVISDSDFRAPIFYDQNNTNWWVDPNSTGTSAKFAGNVEIHGDLKMNGTDSFIWTPNADNRYTGFWDARNSVVALKVNTNTPGNESVTFGGNGGNTSSVWINTDNQNNYNNYNENIRLFNAGNSVSVIAFGATAGTNGGTPITSILGYSDRFETRVGSTWRQRIYGGHIEVNGSIRPDLMYDRNNTGYYVDPNGTSYVYNLDLAGQAGRFEDKAYVEFYVHGNESTFYPVVIGGASEGYAYKDYSISRRYNWTAPNSWNTSSHKGGLTLTWQHSGDTAWGGNDKEWRVIQFDESYSQVCQGLELARTGGMVVWLRGGGTSGARYRLHSPKGKDANVTIYDGVTSGTSGSGTHNSSTTFTDGGGTNFAAESANTTTRDNRINHRWPVRDRGYLYYNGSQVIHSGSTAQTKSGGLTIQGTFATQGNTLLGNNNGDYTHVNDILYVGATDSGDSHFYFGENSSSWYGEHWYWDSGHTTTRYSRHAGTDSIIEKHDTRYTDRLQVGRRYERLTHNVGYQVGSYNTQGANEAKTNPIYIIGRNYTPTETALGNMYGIGFTTQNNTFLSGFTSGWGQYVASDGDARVWLNAQHGRVEATGDMRAPLYYDKDDTAYYVNPASTSVLNAASFAGDVDFNGGSGALNITNSEIRSDGTSTWQGNPGGDFKMQVHSERWYMVAGNGSNRIVQFRRDGTDTSYIANDGRLHGVGGSGSQDWRAPIFYDSNNTGYYTDPASTSRMNVVWANSYAQDNNGIVKVMFPNGGSMDLGSGNTGAIKIRLPQSWTNTMMSLKITVYDYSTDESFDIRCGGYNHTSGSLHGGSWHNVFSWIDANPNIDRNFTVRFGHDGTKCCIQIGETNSTWSYLDVTVTEFTGGHSQEEVAKWDDGWEVSLVTSNITMGSGSHTRTQTDRNRYMKIMYDIDNTGYVVDPAGTSRTHLTHANYVGIGAANNTSGSYRLNMGGSIDMNNHEVNYVNQLHFNDNVRFYDDGNDSYLNFKYGDSGPGAIKMVDGSNNLDGYFYADGGNIGILPPDGGWGLRVSNGDCESYHNFRIPTGSAGSPSLTTSGDSNTGVFMPGGDVFKITTGGVNAVTVNNTDVQLIRDNVSVKDYLRHYGDTDTYFRFTTDRIRMVAGGVTFIDAVEGATDYLRFVHRGVTIGSNTNPQATLTVDQNSTSTPANGCGTDRSAHIKLENTNTTGSASTCIIFNAKDSGGNMRHGAGIQFKKAIAWSANGQYPGELYFWTRPTSGNQAAAQKLDKDGNAIFKGNVTAYGSLSDRRLKENIEPIADAVAKVEQLEGVTFDYKKDGRRSTGLIAQDLEKVLPEAVYTTTEVEGTEEHMAIHYGNTVGLLVNAIKEQQQTINALTKRIEQLEANSLEEK